MVKASKLYEQLITSRQSMRFPDFQRLIEAFGFGLSRSRGSHMIYKHERVPFVLNIQPRGHEAKRYQLDEFLDMVQKYGLRIED